MGGEDYFKKVTWLQYELRFYSFHHLQIEITNGFYEGGEGNMVTSPDVKFRWITLVKCCFRSADMDRLCKHKVLLKLEQLCSTEAGQGRRWQEHGRNFYQLFLAHADSKRLCWTLLFRWLTPGKPLKSWTGIQHVAAASWMLRLTQKCNLYWE